MKKINKHFKGFTVIFHEDFDKRIAQRRQRFKGNSEFSFLVSYLINI